MILLISYSSDLNRWIVIQFVPRLPIHRPTVDSDIVGVRPQQTSEDFLESVLLRQDQDSIPFPPASQPKNPQQSALFAKSRSHLD